MFHGFIPHVMGTRLDILMIHSNLPLLNMLWAHITDELERLDKMLNRFDATSEVSKLNSHTQQDSVSVSAELEDILRSCQYYYEKTLHLFDITLNDFSQIQISPFHPNQLLPWQAQEILLQPAQTLIMSASPIPVHTETLTTPSIP